MTYFNPDEYKKRLMSGGMDEEEAASLVAKIKESRARKGQDAVLVGQLFGLSKFGAAGKPDGKDESQEQAVASSKKNQPVKKQTASGAVATEAVIKKTEEIKRQKKKVEQVKKAVRNELSDKANEVQQRALLQKSRQEVIESQLTLFDIAPWDDDMRAMPNDWLRSALFTTRNKRMPREVMDRQSVYHVHQDVSITYTGAELRAYDDELVFLQVLEYGKRVPPGEPVTFTFYEICTDLDWPINKGYYDRVETCLTRMQATAVQFSSKRVGRLESLSLISRFRILNKGNNATQRCQVEIDLDILYLFAGKYYSRFIWEPYRKLTPTARRLFDYFVTHKEPFPLSLESFKSLCGSDSNRPSRWREQVRKACTELVGSQLVKEAWVNDDKIYCNR